MQFNQSGNEGIQMKRTADDKMDSETNLIDFISNSLSDLDQIEMGFEKKLTTSTNKQFADSRKSPSAQVKETKEKQNEPILGPRPERSVPNKVPHRIAANSYEQVIEDFCSKLADFYQTQYMSINTNLLISKDVRDVWVSMTLLTDKGEGPTLVDQDCLIESLPEAHQVVLLAGESGMGKTTVIKKIANVWAVDRKENAKSSVGFELVLAVPLRCVGEADSFLQMAIDYFTIVLGLTSDEKEQISRYIISLKSKLLICLDGLDEYKHFANSPFKHMFKDQLDNTSRDVNLPTLYTQYRLFITGRPYAFATPNQDFVHIRYDMCNPTNENLPYFVESYCRTTSGKEKVFEYFKENSNIVRIPFVITTICYLADLDSEIPSNLTVLYEKFIGLILKKEKDNFKDKVDLGNWNVSSFVQTTGRLAFEGCMRGRKEFPIEETKKYKVSTDSFTSGFLLYKYDTQGDCFKADFPHISIQEFFAALFCFGNVGKDSFPYREWILALIFKPNCQFGRFFLGLCSKHEKFSQMLEWMTPVFEKSDFILYCAIDQIFIAVSLSLCDCSAKENRQFGSKMFGVLTRYREILQSKRNIVCWSRGSASKSASLNEEFCRGLHLKLCNKNSLDQGWFVASNEQECAELTVIAGCSSKEIWKSVAKAKVLVWLFAGEVSRDSLSKLKEFPGIQSLVLRVDRYCNYEVTFQLIYSDSAKDQDNLQHISLAYDQANVLGLQKAFQPLEKIPGVCIRLGERQHQSNVCRCTYRVKSFTNQGSLVEAVLQSYLEHYATEEIPEESNCVIS